MCKRMYLIVQVPLPAVDARVQILNKSLRKLQVELRQVSTGHEGDMVPSWWFDPSYKSTVEESAEGLPDYKSVAFNSSLKPVRTHYSFLWTHSKNCSQMHT